MVNNFNKGRFGYLNPYTVFNQKYANQPYDKFIVGFTSSFNVTGSMETTMQTLDMTASSTTPVGYNPSYTWSQTAYSLGYLTYVDGPNRIIRVYNGTSQLNQYDVIWIAPDYTHEYQIESINGNDILVRAYNHNQTQAQVINFLTNTTHTGYAVNRYAKTVVHNAPWFGSGLVAYPSGPGHYKFSFNLTETSNKTSNVYIVLYTTGPGIVQEFTLTTLQPLENKTVIYLFDYNAAVQVYIGKRYSADGNFRLNVGNDTYFTGYYDIEI